MAVLVVEDGSTVANANSYVTSAELNTYLYNRGLSLSGSVSGADLLIRAMDYLESQNFTGVKNLSTQSLQWPRSYVYIDGYSVDNDSIPTELKEAQMEIAYEIDSGNDPLAQIDRETKREKVGDLEVEYKNGSSSKVITPSISAKLRKLLSVQNSSMVFRA